MVHWNDLYVLFEYVCHTRQMKLSLIYNKAQVIVYWGADVASDKDDRTSFAG